MIIRESLVFRTLIAIARQREGYDEPRSRALLELLATADAVHSFLRQSLHAFRLTDVQFATLVVLRAIDPEFALPTTLANHTSTSRATMTAVLDNLISRALVVRTRSGDDRRNYQITLTDLGRTLADQAEAAILDAISTLAQPLSDADPHKIVSICETLAPRSLAHSI